MGWNKAITEAGYQLIAQTLLGTRIDFTRIVIGDGIRSTGFSSATDAVHALYSLPIESKLRSGTKVTVTSGITPDDLEAGYDLTEIVVFAKPEDGAEICFSAACNDEGGIHVDPNSNNVSMDGRIRWAYEISPEGNVTIDMGGLLWADYDHRHENATDAADGFMAAADKDALDKLCGWIDPETGVAHGLRFEE